MNVIDTGRVTKDQAAALLGLKVYDVALPQQWLDDACLTLRLACTQQNLYGTILSGTVWCYDGSLMGFPYALTVEAFELLFLLNSLKHIPSPVQSKVLKVRQGL